MLFLVMAVEASCFLLTVVDSEETVLFVVAKLLFSSDKSVFKRMVGAVEKH